MLFRSPDDDGSALAPRETRINQLPTDLLDNRHRINPVEQARRRAQQRFCHQRVLRMQQRLSGPDGKRCRAEPLALHARLWIG